MPTGLNPKKSVRIVNYDFARDGGAVGDVVLSGATIPADAIITNVLIDVKTALAGGTGAKVALAVDAAEDLLEETEITSVTGITAGIPVGTAASAVKLDGSCPITLSISVAALTAGAFNVIVEYVISD